ncbi:MAG: DUF4384 domain-containing protein [Muribaculaceae bacterium]|nr:DUF4384 domain-containing protein [Muribaculaceae bacterium]
MILLGCVNISAQKPVKVKSTYTYHANRNETPADAERIALLRAQIKAIEETFGTNVSETASSIVSTQFDENFFSSYSNSSVKGEWIETIGKPIYSYEFDDRIPVITCTVEGYVKEIVGIRTDFEAKVLRNSPNLRFESIEFSDGDEMYLYFKSPAGGYLTVFLLCNEDDVALCLLPYRECKEGAFRVDADKEYFLFSKDRATVYPEWVDEYKLSTDRQIEFNDLMIIFSPERFNKLSLNVNEEDITAIKETSIGKFNKWLANLQSKNNDITLNKLTIKILNK